jgi:hypothetical protein
MIWRWRFGLAIALFRVAMWIAPPDFARVVNRIWVNGEGHARKQNASLGDMKKRFGLSDGR